MMTRIINKWCFHSRINHIIVFIHSRWTQTHTHNANEFRIYSTRRFMETFQPFKSSIKNQKKKKFKWNKNEYKYGGNKYMTMTVLWKKWEREKKNSKFAQKANKKKLFSVGNKTTTTTEKLILLLWYDFYTNKTHLNDKIIETNEFFHS